MDRRLEIARERTGDPGDRGEKPGKGAPGPGGGPTVAHSALLPLILCTRQCATPLLLVFLMHARSLEAASADLLEPLGASAHPVVAFGELAPGMFHSGVDWATGSESRAVAAAADGEIVRLRVSGSGYERALHLRLDDGRELVYAHLSSFAPALEESCLVRQWAGGAYELDWRLEAGTVRVARGEWLGRTGRTPDGRGLLHVEVRVAGLPQNPFLNGFRPPRGGSPSIGAIRLEPLDPTARIDGRLSVKRIQLESGGGRLRRKSRSVLWGPIGVVCESREGANRSENAPWTIRLEVDGVVQFEGDLGGRDVPGRWSPEFPEIERLPRLEQRLYRPSDRDRGRLACGTRIAPGTHRLRVIARGLTGPPDTAEAIIVVRDAPRLEEWIGRPLGRGVWDLGVKIEPPHAEDPETMRLWIDLTEDGTRFPVRTPLGHLGDGWFLGEIASFKPAGRLGLRTRIQTKDGIESWEPTVALQSAGDCAGAPLDSPRVVVAPRWMELRFPATCIPDFPPEAVLIRSGGETPCELFEEPQEDGNAPVWRFFADPRRSRGLGSPEVELRVDGVRRRWTLPGLAHATPAADFAWTSPDGALTIEIPAATFYAPVWVSWSSTPRAEGPVGGEEIARGVRGMPAAEERLSVRSDLHRLDPSDLEVEGVFRVSIRPARPPVTAEEARRLAVYGRTDPREGWVWRGGLWTGSAVVAVVDRLEEWILLEDLTEPWLYAMDPAPGEERSAPVASLTIHVREQGAGIDSRDLEVVLDGRPVPAAWNSTTRQVRVDLREPLLEGLHRWSVRIPDRAGNKAERAADFNIWVQGP